MREDWRIVMSIPSMVARPSGKPTVSALVDYVLLVLFWSAKAMEKSSHLCAGDDRSCAVTGAWSLVRPRPRAGVSSRASGRPHA
jgi:hypothetical protein